MSTTVLQTFMRLNLLDLEGDDTRLEKLREAATTLADEFGARPISMAVPALLAILREDAQNPTDAFHGTSRAIENHWSTYQTVFRDGKALTLYRAVALQALVQAIEARPAVGTAVALLMRNFRNLLKFGKLQPAIQLLIDAAEGALKSELPTVGVHAAAETPSPPLAAAEAPKFDRAPLTKRIDAAVGPHNRAGQPGENPNPHWSNQGNQWSHEFSDRIVAIIGEYVDSAVREAAKLDAKNLLAVASRITSLSRIDPTVKQSTALLWWRQALYSESAEKSYRRLGQSDAVLHAVADLCEHLPHAYEPAVESFLSETVLALGLGSKVRDIKQFQGSTAPATSALDDCLPYDSPLGLVIAAVLSKSDDALVCTPSLPAEEWAVWFLREVMAIRAVAYIQEESEQTNESNE